MRDGVILIAQDHVTRVCWTSLYTDTSSSLVGRFCFGARGMCLVCLSGWPDGARGR